MLSWCLGGTIATVLIPGTLHDRAVCCGSAALFVGSYLLRNDDGSPTERVRKMFPVAIVQSLAAMGVCLGGWCPTHLQRVAVSRWWRP
jgi:hypothetical protein